MKISVLKVILCARNIVKLIDAYIEARKPYSEEGKKVSVSERAKNKEQAYIVLESIIQLLMK